MRATTLLKPGKFSNSERLRRDVALAISNIEVAKAHGADGQGAELAAFLADSAQKTPGYTAPLPPATTASVVNGAAIKVVDADNNPSTINGVAVVANRALTQITLPASTALLPASSTVPIRAGTAPADVATLVVANGATSATLPGTKTILTSGTKVNAVAVTGTGNFATPTIANGVLTGIVLSAS